MDFMFYRSGYIVTEAHPVGDGVGVTNGPPLSAF